MRKIVLEEQDIKQFEQMVNELPCFARNVSENMIVANYIQNLMKFMGDKIQPNQAQTLEEPTKPIGGGGGSPIKPK